jgi:hypothetical protein
MNTVDDDQLVDAMDSATQERWERQYKTNQKKSQYLACIKGGGNKNDDSNNPKRKPQERIPSLRKGREWKREAYYQKQLVEALQ